MTGPLTGVRVTLRGESWIRADAAAACYACDLALVESALALGLLGPGERVGSLLFLRTVMLDRLAVIVRLHLHHEIPLGAVAALLELGDDD